MKDYKLTGWIKGSAKPIRVGVYQTKSPAGTQYYQHWNGSHWGLMNQSAKGAQAHRGISSYYQNNKWRGLTTKGGK